MPTPSDVRISRARRIAFVAWIGVSTATIGIGFVGLTSLVIAWFGANQGVANPVTDIGYGAFTGIITLRTREFMASQPAKEWMAVTRVLVRAGACAAALM